MLRAQGLSRADGLWISIAVLLSSAQIAATLLDRSFWPVSAYNVFNFQPGPRFVDFEIGLTDTEGHIQYVHPGHVMPLDFFRVNALIRDRFVLRPDPITQARIARLSIERLNADAWFAWDERYAPAKSLYPFRQFEVFIVEHDTVMQQVIQRRSLYSYASLR